MTTTATSKTEFLKKIEQKQVHVGVIGLGYVGLPLALSFTERGYRVTGFDVDAEKVDKLMKGETYIMHMDPQRVAAAVHDKLFEATADFDRLEEPDALLIAVPTPLTPQREPDMKYVVMTSEQVRDRLRPGQLVVLESTTYPGTTDELVRGILEQSKLVCGKDFYLAFSPEREDPGNKSFNTRTIPKVVGGVDAASGEIAAALYEAAIDKVVLVGSARAAEATKLTENIFRAVNIALVNELAILFHRLGL
ncbi:MAG: nucleotide sugar dehydrogenase, partial [Myxococcota bacterium]